MTEEQALLNAEERVNWLEDRVSLLAGHPMEVSPLLKPARGDNKELRAVKLMKRLDILEARFNALSQAQDKALKVYIVNILGEELR